MNKHFFKNGRVNTEANFAVSETFLKSLLVGGQTLGSVTTFLGRNHMNLFGKFNVFEVIFARAVRC